MFDETELENLSSEPIEGMEEAFENWQETPEYPPPPDPGEISFFICNLRRYREVGAKKYLAVTVDFQIVGGKNDGKKIYFVELDNRLRQRNGLMTSSLIDCVKSMGVTKVPLTNKDWMGLLKELIEGQKVGKFQHDWEGYCATCGKNKLLELTGSETDEDAKAYMVAMKTTDIKAYYDIYGQKDKFAMKFKSYRAFPVVNGQKQYVAICPDCGEQIRARSRVVRFLKP